MADEHARLAPSSAPQWVACPGSVLLQEQFPRRDEDTDAADEGTLAHAIAADVLTGRKTLEQTGATSEMTGYIKVYIGAVRAVGLLAEIEKRVECFSIHPAVWGTCDAYIIDWLNRVIYVFDFKYGWGVVEAFGNWQALTYTSGIYDLIGPEAIDWTFNLTIVQPRPYHRFGPVRSWRVTAPELRNYTRTLRVAAEEALGNDPLTTAGPHCKHCSARHACPALRAASLNIVDWTTDATPTELPPDALGREVELLRRAQAHISARLTGLEAEAMAVIQKGTLVPGWTVDHTPGREEWAKPVKEVLALGSLMGVSLAKPAEPITPKQARDAGVPTDLVASYSKRKTGAAKLVPLTTTDAQRIFGGQA